MKFAELSEASQLSARDVLNAILKMEFETRKGLDENRAKYFALYVKKAFVELESEEQLPACGSEACCGKGVVGEIEKPAIKEQAEDCIRKLEAISHEEKAVDKQVSELREVQQQQQNHLSTQSR